MTDPQVQENLDKIADYLDEHGWTQGHLWDGEGACLFGALRAALGPLNRSWDEVEEIGDRLGLPCDDAVVYDITAWNDVPFRTKEQVVGMLRGKDWREL